LAPVRGSRCDLEPFSLAVCSLRGCSSWAAATAADVGFDRTPTTDTYSAEQTQEEFFYEFPHYIMDLLWYAYENDYDPAEVGEVMDMTAEEVERNYRNFGRRSETTEYLRTPPINDYIFI
jgi:NH3-dependent NAD+ synthetase